MHEMVGPFRPHPPEPVDYTQAWRRLRWLKNLSTGMAYASCVAITGCVVAGCLAAPSMWTWFTCGSVLSSIHFGLKSATQKWRCPRCHGVFGARETTWWARWRELSGTCTNCELPNGAKHPSLEAATGRPTLPPHE